jgi:thioredoxin 1
MLAPVFDSLSEELTDVDFVKVDIDQSLELAQKFGITTVPTMMIFKDGKVVDTLVGFMPKDNLKAKVQAHL